MSATDHAVTLLGDRDSRLAEQSTDGAEASTFSTSVATDQTAQVAASRTLSKPASDFRLWGHRHIRQLVVFDALVGGLAASAATLAPSTRQPTVAAGWVALILLGVLSWPLWVAVSSGYLRRHVGVGTHQILAVVRALAAAILLAALPAAWFGLDHPLNMVAVAAPMAALFSIGIRLGWHQMLHFRQRSGTHRRRMIMVGSTDSVGTLTEMIHNYEPSIQVAGVCVPSDEVSRAQAVGLPVLGDVDQVAAIATDLGCHAVAVAGGDAVRADYLRHLAWSLEDVQVDLLVHPGPIDVARPRIHIQAYERFALLQLDQPHFTGWQRRVKRAMDLFLTITGIMLVWPLLLVTALMIKIEDRGPIIFKQIRVGVDGKTFTMYKFRSMVIDAERQLAALAARNEGAGPLFKMQKDPRVTRVGAFIRKYSIDELPQLFNVLTGNMSLVGPRPSLQSEVDEYAADTRRRLKAMPGMTGLWQVSGRSLLSWEESIRLDLWYVENWSISQDLKIIFKTARAVLAKNGAY